MPSSTTTLTTTTLTTTTTITTALALPTNGFIALNNHMRIHLTPPHQVPAPNHGFIADSPNMDILTNIDANALNASLAPRASVHDTSDTLLTPDRLASLAHQTPTYYPTSSASSLLSVRTEVAHIVSLPILILAAATGLLWAVLWVCSRKPKPCLDKNEEEGKGGKGGGGGTGVLHLAMSAVPRFTAAMATATAAASARAARMGRRREGHGAGFDDVAEKKYWGSGGTSVETLVGRRGSGGSGGGRGRKEGCEMDEFGVDGKFENVDLGLDSGRAKAGLREFV
ncbi:hypothetical protein LTS18_010665 [Coniosporium uncinatum]|uniref:Uncharacterized protein n=1 Tax=Coniosporium uncinatum TaxID=93489 RepID=A0ACC3DZE8_9PEZI|nr:hypothetical protein LTS18_010665 [Coniosporium uncinatum]